MIAYAASKSAYLGMVHSLAVELAPDIRVNGIAPGWIVTPMLERAVEDPERKQRFLDKTPLGEMGQPEDIGFGAVYLSSTAGRFVTGVVLPVDGGVTMAL